MVIFSRKTCKFSCIYIEQFQILVPSESSDLPDSSATENIVSPDVASVDSSDVETLPQKKTVSMKLYFIHSSIQLLYISLHIFIKLKFSNSLFVIYASYFPVIILVNTLCILYLGTKQTGDK